MVMCVSCGKKRSIHNMWADLEGESFVDYYCDMCADELDEQSPRYVNGKLTNLLLRVISKR